MSGTTASSVHSKDSSFIKYSRLTFVLAQTLGPPPMHPARHYNCFFGEPEPPQEPWRGTQNQSHVVSLSILVAGNAVLTIIKIATDQGQRSLPPVLYVNVDLQQIVVVCSRLPYTSTIVVVGRDIVPTGSFGSPSENKDMMELWNMARVSFQRLSVLNWNSMQ